MKDKEDGTNASPFDNPTAADQGDNKLVDTEEHSGDDEPKDRLCDLCWAPLSSSSMDGSNKLEGRNVGS